MLIETSFVKESGDIGGVPMFSRTGRYTIAESLCFQSKNDNSNVQSTFAKERESVAVEKESSEEDDWSDVECGENSQRKSPMDSIYGGGPREPKSLKSVFQTIQVSFDIAHYSPVCPSISGRIEAKTVIRKEEEIRR